MYSWRIAKQSDFYKIYALIQNSPVREDWNIDEIRRRIIIPLFLDQLILFYKGNKIYGFLTIAFMDGQSADHQTTIGVLPSDWRSGDQFWVVDYLAPYGDGAKMLRQIVKDVDGIVNQKIRFFRFKYKQVRGVSP